MIGDRLVVGVSGPADLFPGPGFQNRDQKVPINGNRGQSPQIFADLFCDSCRKDAGIRTGIGCQLLFIQFLGDRKCLVRADLEIS